MPDPRSFPFRRLRAAVLLLAPLLAACSEAPPARVPNGNDLFLCVIDTLRADHVGCYGYTRDTTPRLDALARAGARVADVWAQASWTGPSMVSMFTGRHVAADFVRMPPVATLAERLREAGYLTIGLQFNVLLGPGTGYDRGFEHYRVEPEARELGRLLQESAADPRPRFLYVHLVDPHDPYAPFPEFDVFRAPDEPARERVERVAEFLRERDPSTPPAAIAEEAIAAARAMEREIALYDGDVRQGDRVLGTFLDLVARQGRADRTVVVVASDHGESLWDHREDPVALAAEHAGDPLHAFKRTHNSLLTEELLAVPLVFAGPGVPAGVVVGGLAENVDVVPTVLELLGLEAGDGPLDGASLAPRFAAAARGENASGKEHVFAHIALAAAVKDARGNKLVLHARTRERTLFDLASDPKERRPLPAESEAGRALQAAAAAFLRSALAPTAGEDVVDDEIRARLDQLGY